MNQNPAYNVRNTGLIKGERMARARLSLGTKFTLILIVVFAIGLVATWLILSNVLERRAEQEISTQSIVLMETMNSIRSYTSAHVGPLLANELAASSQFISETVPAFSARTVFETLRSNAAYSDFFYKEAAFNPTNPRDLVDDFEAQLLRQFRSDNGITQLTGFTTVNGEQVFYNARPMRVGSESCLACHGEPENAPTSLINTYGPNNGFGWQLNEIIAAQILYVPATEVFETAAISLRVVMASIVGILAAVLVIVNFLLKRSVVTPAVQIAELARKLGENTITPDSPELQTLKALTSRTDELGETARVFQTMTQNVYEREMGLKEEIEQLIIQIDQQKRETQVKEIVDTDFFNDLQAKAKQLRSERDDE